MFASFVGAALTDAVDVSAAGSEAAHEVLTRGDVAVERAGEVVGGHDLRRAARVLRGAGSSVSYALRVTPGESTTLEFEELYGRDTLVRGYLVYVDDEKVALRTWQGCGAGPVHYFVRVPAGERDRVRVRLVNQLDAPVAIGRVWAWADLDRHAESGGMAVPFYLAPTVGLGTEFERDLARLRTIRASFDRAGGPADVRPAWTTWVAFAGMTDAAIRARLDDVLLLAEASGMPVQVCFDTWWANTPSGSDGRGGFWTDVQYQQVVWNETRKQYQLSIPNRWSSTPWLTVNHPDLTAYKTRRLRAATAILRELTTDPARRDLVLAVNLDNEPVYWASGNAGLGSELLWADLNPRAVEAAKRDGVTLDATDGLARDERLWLFRNLLHYNAAIGRAAVEGLGRPASDPDPLRANVYTQAMVANAALQFPMLDAAYPFWETAAPAGVRVGGEWNGGSLREREAVLHQVPLGRNAAVNAECGDRAEDVAGVPLAYATGQRYWAGYNYPLDQLDVAAATVKDPSAPLAAFRYLPIVLDNRFADDHWQRHVVDHGGLQVTLIGNTTAMAAAPAAAGEPGFLTYRLDAPGDAWDGLLLELSGRAFVFQKRDDRVHVRVLAGETPDPATMREVGRFSDTGDINAVHRFDLGDAARERKTAFVRIELHAPNLHPTVLSWCSVYHVRFTRPWPANVTVGLPEQDESLATQRRQNLVVSWRRDAELAMAELEPAEQGEALAAARDAYRHGEYARAYELANLRLASLAPALAPTALPPAGPRSVAGTVLRVAGRRLSVAPDAADGAEVLVVAPDASIERGEADAAAGPAELSDLRRGDRVTVDVGANGVVGAVRATTRTLRGTIAEFRPLAPTAMPMIRLDGEAEPRVIDLNAPVHVGTGDVTPRATMPAGVTLTPGDLVRLRVHPKSGRAFEVWKE